MKTRLLTIILSSALLLFASVYLIYLAWNGKKSDKPTANNGVLDLRNYDFGEKGLIKLDGEWEFIPGKLLNSLEFNKLSPYYVPVPSLWTKYEHDGKKVPEFTSGTYRLKVLVKDSKQDLGIKTTNIRMSNSMFINGINVNQSGNPKEDHSYVPHNIPYVSYFSTKGKQIEVLVHVANFDYATGGGIMGSIFLGDQKSIGTMRENSLAYDWITISAFLTMFLYFIGTYLHTSKDSNLLFFSLFCLATGLYTGSHGEKVVYSIFPSIPYEIFERIQALSTIIIGLFLLLYFVSSFKKYTHKKIANTLCIAGIILTTTAFLPVRINSELQMPYSIYLFVVLLYISYIQGVAIYRRAVGATYLTISLIAIILYFIVGSINVNDSLELTILPPMLPFICLLMLTLFISKRFTDSFSKKEELTKALIKIDKLKDEFLAKTSHEFRTPLHGIIAISQNMLDHKESLKSDQIEKVSTIVDISQRLSHLVNDILDFSKLKQGELKITIVSVDLFAVTHMVTSVFHYLIDKDIKIINRMERGLFVLGDEGRIRQILYNLIDNAIKNTEKGVIEINSYRSDSKVFIKVSDSGPGISSEDLNTIFDPFQQFGNTSIGTGLGLPISKQLVELQGGEISIQSEIGKGTECMISLPEAPHPSNSLASSEQIPTREEWRKVHISIPYVNEKAGRKKILIADDDHTNLKILIDTLVTEEYFIIAVDNGKAVLEQLKFHADVDLIILDIMMPELSGYEVCQAIRKSYHLSELPVLMLTAAIHPEDMVAAFQSGANDFLHKPLESSELKTRIRNLLLMKESAETATKMEIAFLQAQIKPHFIYNVLNSILSLSYLDIDKSRKMITDFATFLRGSFSFANTNQLVPLEKELTLLQSYLDIHKTRFPKQLEWGIECAEDIHCLFPPLLLQPLVENSIIHGFQGISEGGKINLSISREREMLIFQLTDNGKGISNKKLQQVWNDAKPLELGVGLHNIAKRLKYYEQASIAIESEENIGTTILINFPLIQEEKGEKKVVKSGLSG
ncbi:ATP-binding protein [Bacillus sp. CGMCC 1.16607]|uniref:hybrid sensor histidine kinase/response regulator n=1 Tax=Bacillus sp. CGMCC 1.16607 TaxID=3351842 RepID=UPI00362B3B68